MKTGLISFGEHYAVDSKDIMCQGDANLHGFFQDRVFADVCLYLWF